MNFNILAYILYGLITIWTIIHLGKILHTSGYYYVKQLFIENKMTVFINNTLLAGYYLTNIGYVLLTLKYWEDIASFKGFVENVSEKTGLIFILLATMHFINIALLSIYSKIIKREKI